MVCAEPDFRAFRTIIAEGEVASAGNDYDVIIVTTQRAIISNVSVKWTVEGAVVAEAGIGGEGGAAEHLLAVGVVACVHDEQAGALAGWIEAVGGIAEFPGNEIRITVTRVLRTTRKVAPKRKGGGDVILSVLPKKRNVGRLGEIIGTAADVVSIRVNDGDAGSGEHVGMGGGAFTSGHVIIVVAEAIHYSVVHAEGEGTRLIVAAEVAADTVEAPDLVYEIIIGDAHAGQQVISRAGRSPEMLAEE